MLCVVLCDSTSEVQAGAMQILCRLAGLATLRAYSLHDHFAFPNHLKTKPRMMPHMISIIHRDKNDNDKVRCSYNRTEWHMNYTCTHLQTCWLIPCWEKHLFWVPSRALPTHQLLVLSRNRRMSAFLQAPLPLSQITISSHLLSVLLIISHDLVIPSSSLGSLLLISSALADHDRISRGKSKEENKENK